MKKFFEISKYPLVIALVASVLYVVDALVAGSIKPGLSLMWVAFAVWTVFFGVDIKQRLKALAEITVGFIVATLMLLISCAFNVSLYTVSISTLLGVFVMNLLVMYIDNVKKLQTSITGIFVGIFLTFSGLGVGYNPLNSVAEGFTMYGLIMLYSVFGLVCGLVSITTANKIKNKNSLEKELDSSFKK